MRASLCVYSNDCKSNQRSAERRVAKNDTSLSTQGATERDGATGEKMRTAYATRAAQQLQHMQRRCVEAATLAVEHVLSLTPTVTQNERGRTVMAMARGGADREIDVAEALEGAP